MLVGDFNMIRSNSDRNRPGGNSNTMLAFNDIIQTHDLEEIPLKGRQYTWSNMQNTPLLKIPLYVDYHIPKYNGLSYG
jgi:hypothetical protein